MALNSSSVTSSGVVSSGMTGGGNADDVVGGGDFNPMPMPTAMPLPSMPVPMGFGAPPLFFGPPPQSGSQPLASAPPPPPVASSGSEPSVVGSFAGVMAGGAIMMSPAPNMGFGLVFSWATGNGSFTVAQSGGGGYFATTGIFSNLAGANLPLIAQAAATNFVSAGDGAGQTPVDSSTVSGGATLATPH